MDVPYKDSYFYNMSARRRQFEKNHVVWATVDGIQWWKGVILARGPDQSKYKYKVESMDDERTYFVGEEDLRKWNPDESSPPPRPPVSEHRRANRQRSSRRCPRENSPPRRPSPSRPPSPPRRPPPSEREYTEQRYEFSRRTGKWSRTGKVAGARRSERRSKYRSPSPRRKASSRRHSPSPRRELSPRRRHISPRREPSPRRRRISPRREPSPRGRSVDRARRSRHGCCRSQSREPIQQREIKEGDLVSAKWTDGRWHPATVISVYKEGIIDVLYDDYADIYPRRREDVKFQVVLRNKLRQAEDEKAALENEKAVLENEKEELEKEKLCKICFDKERSHVITPCFHFCLCHGCAGKIVNKCPMCKGRIGRIQKVYCI